MCIKVKFKDQDVYKVRFRALQTVAPGGATYIAIDATNDVISTVNGETYADIQALIDADKPVVVRFDNDLDFYYFETFGFSDSSGIHRRLNFRCVMGSIVYTLTLRDDNTWAFSETSLQSESITDTGSYFTTDTVEGALQEIGAGLAGAYSKPAGGIPESDLSFDVKTKLNSKETNIITIETENVDPLNPYKSSKTLTAIKNDFTHNIEQFVFYDNISYKLEKIITDNGVDKAVFHSTARLVNDVLTYYTCEIYEGNFGYSAADFHTYTYTVTGGAVESINGKTGAVVLNAEDVGAQRTLIAGSGITIIEREDGDIIQSDASCGDGAVYFVEEDGGVPIAQFTLNQTQDCEINVNNLTARLSTKVNNLETSLSNNYRTTADQDAIDAQKQSIITDLETIRSGAARGATAVQPEAGKGLFSGSYNDLTDKPTIPDAVTEGTISSWGFTKNTGTYSKPTGGIPKADLASAVQSSLDKSDRVDTLVPDAATAQNQLADKLFVYAQAGQVTPLFANSTADCTDTTKVYVLPDGYIYGYIAGAWTNTGHQFTSLDTLEKVIDATCDIETISGGNYNLLKVSEVSFSSRLQDNVAGITASTATNIVTGWIPVRQGKYYAVSALVDGIKDAAAGAGRTFVQRINAKKADGTILVYNKYPTELLTELSRGKAYSVPTDATHMMFHIQIQDRTPQSLDISTSAKLKAFEPMIIEGDTAALAVSNSIDFTYVDGDADVPAIVNYTLKHDTTKEDKVSLSPYYRNVDYHMMPTLYYKGVGTDYDTTFGQNTSYTTFITAWKTLITGHGGYVTETELGNASDNQKIYLYDFKPSRITNQRTNMPKIVIVAGQHGTEKSNVYGLYYFVNNLLNKWNESPVLEYLRNHVELMIIPVLNTYGFDNFAYKNANGVNINRNYDANWVLLADTNSDQYGGAAPFDQPETQIVRDLLLDNDDASLIIDFHTNGNGAVAQYSYINYYGVSPNSDAYFNRLIDAVAHQLASISANFNVDYSLNKPDTMFGWLNNASGTGLLRDWASDNGFASVLVEGFNGFPNGTSFIADVYKANEEIIANWLVTALNYLKG